MSESWAGPLTRTSTVLVPRYCCQVSRIGKESTGGITSAVAIAVAQSSVKGVRMVEERHYDLLKVLKGFL